MIKIFLKSSTDIYSAIETVAEVLGIELVNEKNSDIRISILPSSDGKNTIKLKIGHADITYSGGIPAALRSFAKLIYRYKNGISSFEYSELPIFEKCGAMFDVSRNAVLNVRTVKELLVAMALMGMNTFMLYTEDTYELEGYPYFGHLRGRYTREELRELDDFAFTLGIELIPCIQTLGHLATHLIWQAAAGYKDTENSLLVGEDETYKLIDRMLKTVSECFRTRRVHLGLDETKDIGTGKYFDRHGYRDRTDILLEHIDRVVDMATSRGLEPMMWSDMYFRLAGRDIPGYRDYDLRVSFDGKKIKKPGKGITQIFWDYYHPDEDFYLQNIKRHREHLGSDPIFAGAVWTFSGHCPLFSMSFQNTFPALSAAKKCGTREILATVWHSGSECSLVLSLAGLAWYADYAYLGEYNEESVAECFSAAVGENYSDVLSLELPEHPDGGKNSLSRALLYNDPLLGIIDAHIGKLDIAGHYRRISEMYDNMQIGGLLSPAFLTVRALSHLLTHKADFGKRLTEAYLAHDRDALALLADECDVIIGLINELSTAHYNSWMRYNKPFGWEVHDIRYGGLKERILRTKSRILAFLDGSLESIDELAERRLRIDCKDVDSGFDGWFLSLKYQRYATVNIL